MKGWEILNIFESQESFQNLEFINKMPLVQGVTVLWTVYFTFS